MRTHADARLHADARTHTHTCAHMHTRAHVHARTYVRTHTHMHAQSHTRRAHARACERDQASIGASDRPELGYDGHFFTDAYHMNRPCWTYTGDCAQSGYNGDKRQSEAMNGLPCVWRLCNGCNSAGEGVRESVRQSCERLQVQTDARRASECACARAHVCVCVFVCLRARAVHFRASP
jgi:hypothetical protein